MCVCVPVPVPVPMPVRERDRVRVRVRMAVGMGVDVPVGGGSTECGALFRARDRVPRLGWSSRSCPLRGGSRPPVSSPSLPFSPPSLLSSPSLLSLPPGLLSFPSLPLPLLIGYPGVSFVILVLIADTSRNWLRVGADLEAEK